MLINRYSLLDGRIKSGAITLLINYLFNSFVIQLNSKTIFNQYRIKKQQMKHQNDIR